MSTKEKLEFSIHFLIKLMIEVFRGSGPQKQCQVLDFVYNCLSLFLLLFSLVTSLHDFKKCTESDERIFQKLRMQVMKLVE